MVSSRLKDLIFKKLYKDLSHVEIIHFHDYIWFIDREEKFWYFRYCKSDGRLLWRYGFFTKFFVLFTMDESDFTPVISSWVEDVLNCKVDTTIPKLFPDNQRVEEVLNYKVSTTSITFLGVSEQVKKVLNYNVNTSETHDRGQVNTVEEVLNYKVVTTGISRLRLFDQVEDVLNCKVSTTKTSLWH